MFPALIMGVLSASFEVEPPQSYFRMPPGDSSFVRKMVADEGKLVRPFDPRDGAVLREGRLVHPVDPRDGAVSPEERLVCFFEPEGGAVLRERIGTMFPSWGGGGGRTECIVVPSNMQEFDVRYSMDRSSSTSIAFEADSRLTRIGEEACSRTRIRCVLVPSSVELLDKGCFRNCESLVQISFERHSHLERIEEFAFSGSRISFIAIPERVGHIGARCFEGCPLIRITFGENSQLKTVGAEAFSCTQLISCVRFPTGVACENSPFQGSPLEEVWFDNERAGIFSGLFAGAKACAGEITVPQALETIGTSFFAGCTLLTSIAFEAGSRLRIIGRKAFAFSSLLSVVIPASVRILGDECFHFCESLSSVSFEAGSQLAEIREGAFSHSSLSFFVVPARVEKLGSSCFSNCSRLTEIAFEAGSQLTRMKRCTFLYSGLQAIMLPRSIEKISSGCFSCCASLIAVTFEEGSHLKVIKARAFDANPQPWVFLPDGKDGSAGAFYQGWIAPPARPG